MQRKNLLPSLLLPMCLALTPAGAGAADAGSRGRTMADTMLNMMDAMGRFSRDYVDSRSRSQDGFFQPWESMSPENGVPTGPSRESEAPREQPSTADAETMLEGDWLGQGGERLAIRGSRFRLEAGPKRLLEGLLQIRGRLLALHSPQHRQTWIYEYAQNQGRLALRSARGQMLLFRRADPLSGGLRNNGAEPRSKGAPR